MIFASLNRTRDWRAKSYLAMARMMSRGRSGPARLELRGGRFLVIAPHPDDEVMGCFGLLSRASDALDIRVVLVTDGEATRSTSGPAASMRPDETRRALASMGVPEPARLRLPDGALTEHATELGTALVAEIERFGPTHILCPAPNDLTADHSAVARALDGHRGSVWYYRSTWSTFDLRRASTVLPVSWQEKAGALDHFPSQEQVPLADAVLYSAVEAMLEFGDETLSEGYLRAEDFQHREATNMFWPVRLLLSRHAP